MRIGAGQVQGGSMRRHDLEGLRLQIRGELSQYIYLVLDGQLRLLDPVLRRNGVFANWAQTWTIDAAPSLGLEYGQPISSVGTELVRLDTRALLQVNSGWYRCIKDPETFNRFGFNWDNLHNGDTGHSDRGEFIQWQPYGNGDLSNVNGDIFLKDEGQMRHVADPATYQDLFGGTGAVHMDAFNAPPASEIDRSVRLIQAPGRPEIWLLDRNHRRHISDLNAFHYYGFSRGTVHSLPYDQLIEYPEGRPIIWPTPNLVHSDDLGVGET